MSTVKLPDLGPYRVQKLIGRGGMSRVFRCVDSRNGGVVAVKVLSAPLEENSESARRFEREVQAMRQLRHPYIVPLLDYALTPKLSYLVMPHFEQTVADQLAEHLYAPREAAQLLTHVAFALDYAHSLGYIHCDLKPSNLMLDAAGQIYLADFGLAKAIGVQKRQNVGTAAYMAPELAEGGTPDVRSDVYALGVTVCELLSGHRPFEAEEAGVYFDLHRTIMPAAPSQLNPAVAPSLDAPILSALSKFAAQRPQSAGEFARQLEGAVSGLERTTQYRRPPRSARPHLPLEPFFLPPRALAGERPTQPGRDTDPTRTTTQRVSPFTEPITLPDLLPPPDRVSLGTALLLVALALAVVIVLGLLLAQLR